MQSSVVPIEAAPFETEVSKDTIFALRRLLALTIDGEQGFRAAAEEVGMPACKTLLLAYADQRRALAAELSSTLRRFGGEPRDEGTFAARVRQRWWNSIARALVRRDARAILTERERFDARAVATYDKALRFAFEPSIRAIIARHRDAVRGVRESLESLRAG